MIVKFNVKGKERKKLVEAISEHLNIPFEYKGTPSFAYEIGEYVVDRVGTLEGPTKDELIHALKSKYNFEAERDEQTETYTLSIEYPLDSFDEQTIENLEKLIQSKSTLIKRALAIETTKIVLEDDRISFPWFERELTPEELETYTKFIVALCETALKQKRVTAVEKQIENEKYAFRCFLLKLNFIGGEYKADRKLLMSKLSGDSSFKITKRWRKLHEQHNERIADQVKKQYQPGTRVRLIEMDDPYSNLIPGDEGTVSYVDDIGTIHIKWDKGSSLGIVLGVDKCLIIEQ